MFILKFLLILFIAFIVMVVAGIWRLFSSVNRARKQFQEMGQRRSSEYRSRNANNEDEVIKIDEMNRNAYREGEILVKFKADGAVHALVDAQSNLDLWEALA